MSIEKIKAPMPGKVIRIDVKDGDSVKEGQYVCAIESMKMENPILADAPGTVININVKPGHFVQADYDLLIIDYQ